MQDPKLLASMLDVMHQVPRRRQGITNFPTQMLPSGNGDVFWHAACPGASHRRQGRTAVEFLPGLDALLSVQLMLWLFVKSERPKSPVIREAPMML